MPSLAGMDAWVTTRDKGAHGPRRKPATGKMREWSRARRSGRSVPAKPESSTPKRYTRDVRLVIFERLFTGVRGIPEGKAS